MGVARGGKKVELSWGDLVVCRSGSEGGTRGLRFEFYRADLDDGIDSQGMAHDAGDQCGCRSEKTEGVCLPAHLHLTFVLLVIYDSKPQIEEEILQAMLFKLWLFSHISCLQTSFLTLHKVKVSESDIDPPPSQTTTQPSNLISVLNLSSCWESLTLAAASFLTAAVKSTQLHYRLFRCDNGIAAVTLDPQVLASSNLRKGGRRKKRASFTRAKRQTWLRKQAWRHSHLDRFEWQRLS